MRDQFIKNVNIYIVFKIIMKNAMILVNQCIPLKLRSEGFLFTNFNEIGIHYLLSHFSNFNKLFSTALFVNL